MKCRQISVIVRLLNADLFHERYLYPWRDPGRREWGWGGGGESKPKHLTYGGGGGGESKPKQVTQGGGGQTGSHDIHYQHHQNGSALKWGQQ